MWRGRPRPRKRYGDRETWEALLDWRLSLLNCGAGALAREKIMPIAKPGKYSYRRRLPHLQGDDTPVFVTFGTFGRFFLPEPLRDSVLKHCLHDHETKISLHAAVVMPDHVHLLFTPLRDDAGDPFTLAEIMQSLKGASAHTVNKFLGRSGPVWEEESFDHVLRSYESLEQKVEYIWQNPVRRGLVTRPEDYRWLWIADRIL